MDLAIMEAAATNYLVNIGVPGVVLLGIFLLARQWFPKVLDRFDLQLNAERKQCQENHEKTMNALATGHAETMKNIYDSHGKNMECHALTQGKIMQLAADARLQIAVEEAKMQRAHPA